MLDNLRDQASATPFIEDDEQLLGEAPPRPPRASGRFLGMTAPQRFVISLMLLFTVCLLGVLVLLVTGRIVPF